MKLLLALILAHGFGVVSAKTELKRNVNGIEYQVVCIEGFNYIYMKHPSILSYQGYASLTPKFNKNREPEKCQGRKNYGPRK